MASERRVAFPVAAGGRVRRIFGFADWRRYASSGGLHTGVDLAARGGAAVYAAADGEVVRASGGVVAVVHAGGWWSVYRHVAPPLAAVGQQVEVGQVIATVGRRGYLHFEVRAPRRAAFAPGVRAIWAGDEMWAVDPLRWLAMQLPAPRFCGGVTGFPGAKVYARPDAQSEQVGFLPQGAAVEGLEMFWGTHGEIWLRLRAAAERWLPVRSGIEQAVVRACDG